MITIREYYIVLYSITFDFNSLDQKSFTTFGSLGAAGMKWSHGLLALDGQIYGIPSSATAVLRIDPRGETNNGSNKHSKTLAHTST